jgi:hypothetical protein
MRKTLQDTKPSACVRVFVFICPPPLRPPSLQSLSLSSLFRVPSPTTALAPRPNHSLSCLPSYSRLCPPPLFLPCASLFFTPSLRSLPLSSLSRAPSPTTAIAPHPLSPPPSLLQTRKVPEDRLGQVVQLIIVQTKVPAGNTGEGGITHGRRCMC